MNNNNFEITRSDYLFAIKFGTVDNTDFAVDFFRSVKEECGIEIVVCNYFEHREPVNEDNHSNNKKVHFQCHIMNPNILLPYLRKKIAIWKSGSILHNGKIATKMTWTEKLNS